MPTLYFSHFPALRVGPINDAKGGGHPPWQHSLGIDSADERGCRHGLRGWDGQGVDAKRGPLCGSSSAGGAGIFDLSYGSRFLISC